MFFSKEVNINLGERAKTMPQLSLCQRKSDGEARGDSDWGSQKRQVQNVTDQIVNNG